MYTGKTLFAQLMNFLPRQQCPPTKPDEMDASIIRIGVNVAPDWYFTQSIA